jgi:glucose/arabinose dehydrogenase
MKYFKQAILLVLLVSCSISLFSQTENQSERMLVENMIQLYFDGWATGDTTKLGMAMHSSCHLKNYRDGKFIIIDRAKYLSLNKPHPGSKDLVTQIVQLDITGPIGSAKAEIITANDKFTDYFNLMKTNEGWFIVDKISTRVPHKTVEKPLAKPEREIVIDGLKRPWSIAFLSEDEVLISEKEGDVVKVNLAKKEKVAIKGFPTDLADSVEFYTPGDNTGKFEILADPDFNKNKYVYISYAAQNEKGNATRIIRAVLENNSLQKIQTLFVATPYTFERFHYGGGMTFGPDGKLYFTMGERLFNEKNEPSLPIAQDIKDKRGKIYRINPDGSIPKDNPDFGPNSVPGLFAIGIRSAQGTTVNPVTNKIWFSEHGTHQGDEINILNPLANYGWPIKTTGKYRYTEYAPPAINTTFTDPVWSWMHTVAPTGLTFYTGDEFPSWKNNLLVAGLSRGSLWRMTLDGDTIKSAEELFIDERKRLRKVVQSPMGKLYILTDDMNGALVRIKNSSVR